MFRIKKYAGFISGVCGVIAATAIICVCAFSVSVKEVEFGAAYYYVCYKTTDNAVSAFSLSDTVESYGGAGYVLEYDGSFYVTVACYYSEEDALKVCDRLKYKDLNCSVLKAETKKYKLRGINAAKDAVLLSGNLNTLNSVSYVAYECANGLDTGEYGQAEAKEVFKAVKSGLEGLLDQNKNNAFAEKLNALISECGEREKGFIKSGDVRYVQIAVTDCILKAEL